MKRVWHERGTVSREAFERSRNRAGAYHARPQSAGCQASIGPSVPTTKSERGAQDAEALMGIGAPNAPQRAMAGSGKLRSGPIQFRATVDVPNAGLRFALPALLANGVLEHVGQYFQLPPGYYGIDSVFLLLGFMAL
ncbi:MAG: hypothetical protein MUF54_10630 [Polyangiaceae bacterium]|nr:hypothetical protein [Polyangiaceae bacterium]